MLAGQFLGHLQRRQVAALIVVLWRFRRRIIGRCSQRLQPCLLAEAIVGAAIFQQLLNAALIDLQPLALDVRAGRAAVHTTLVRLDAGPRQVAEELLLGRIVRGARVVDVVDADDHRAAVCFGKEVAVEGRPQPVQVDVACEWTPLNLIDRTQTKLAIFKDHHLWDSVRIVPAHHGRTVSAPRSLFARCPAACVCHSIGHLSTAQFARTVS